MSLLVKYLSVPLRYWLMCHPSQSAVVQDNGDVSPLFRERLVVGAHFERVVALLHRNMDLLVVKGVAEGEGGEGGGRLQVLAKLPSEGD